MLGGEAAEGADDGAQLVLAAVAGEDAEEIGGDRVEPELRRESRQARLPASSRETSGLSTSSSKSFESSQRLAERIEAAADGFDLPLVTRKVEQGGRITPC